MARFYPEYWQKWSEGSQNRYEREFLEEQLKREGIKLSRSPQFLKILNSEESSRLPSIVKNWYKVPFAVIVINFIDILLHTRSETDVLKEILEGKGSDLVVAIGPVLMMKFTCDLTKKYNVKTVVSLNPIMVDGTGMCGCCRVTVGGQTRFACVDGPEFDGHKVDFNELIHRLQAYVNDEKVSYEAFQKGSKP